MVRGLCTEVVCSLGIVCVPGVRPPLTLGEATQEKAQRRLCHFSRMSHSGRMDTQLGPGAVAVDSSRSIPACSLAELSSLRFYLEGVLSGLRRCCTVPASPQLSITVRDPNRGQQRHLESMRTGLGRHPPSSLSTT